MAKVSLNWYEVLLKCRKLGQTFGVTDLVESTGLIKEHASAWIGKLVKWGYAKRLEGPRPSTYYLTDYGKEVEEPEFKLPPHPSGPNPPGKKHRGQK